MNVVYGISCDAFVAKAKGVALVPDVGGWHYAPAGISRAIIDRQNIARIPNIGAVDREALVLSRALIQFQLLLTGPFTLTTL